MSIDAKVLEKLAELSRLEIEDTNKPQLIEKLNGIVGFIEQLSEVNTEGVTPMASPTAGVASTREREDAVTALDKREAFMKVSPKSEMGFYVVPRVVE